MRPFILLLLIFICFQSCAETPNSAIGLEFHVDSVQENTQLAPGNSKVIVHVANESFVKSDKILYGYNDESLEAFLNEQNSFQFQLDSGKHVFQFYSSKSSIEGRFAEITTPPIQIESQTVTHVTLNFKTVVYTPGVVKKPVIYLYPTEETAVSVAVKSKGELSFTYSEYKEKWECKAFPSGEIVIGDDSYNYLFWEAKQTMETKRLNQTEGIVVAKENLLSFLESSLDEFGFTSKEKSDFITFWAPQMIQHEATEIRFMFNKECTFFADLEIQPKPDNLLRFYMIWNPIDMFYFDKDRALEIPVQTRSGFTVLEWGGTEIPRGDRPERVK